MNTKLAYIIGAIVILAVMAIIGYKWHKPSTGPVQENITQQSGDQSQQDQSSSSANQSTQQSNATFKYDPNACKDASASDPFKPVTDIKNKTAVLETSMGTIEMQLYDKDAPKTVQNFICLIQRGYYNGIIFHRVSHNFVIQAGDPTGTGSGGESIYGAKFVDELNPNTPSYKAGYITGVLAMANAGPNTNGSQFFIMTADKDLPHDYTIFGKVTKGLDVVQKIGAVPVEPGMFGPDDGKPINTITINKATIK